MFLGLDIGRQYVKMVAADQTKDGYKLVDVGSRLVPEPCLLYTSPSPRDSYGSRMPSSA